MRKTRAFSLIELLFVLLILGTVMSVIAACFDAGFRVYSRVRAFGSTEMDIYLTGEIIERDLKNAIWVPGVPFQGDALLLQFPAIISGAEGAVRPAVVRYWMDAGAGLMRSVDYLGKHLPESNAGHEVLLAGGFSLALSYFDAGSSDDALRQGGWQDSWTGATNAPAAVRIVISGDRLEDGPLVRTIRVAKGVQ